MAGLTLYLIGCCYFFAGCNFGLLVLQLLSLEDLKKFFDRVYEEPFTIG